MIDVCFNTSTTVVLLRKKLKQGKERSKKNNQAVTVIHVGDDGDLNLGGVVETVTSDQILDVF